MKTASKILPGCRERDSKGVRENLGLVMSNGEPKSLLSKKAFFCYKIKQIVDKINMIGKEEAKLILNWEKWYKKRGIPSPFKRETMIEVERVLARSRENQGEELR